MQSRASAIYATGIFIMLVGIIGSFFQISNNDGALAVTGAVLIAGAVISQAVSGQSKD